MHDLLKRSFWSAITDLELRPTTQSRHSVLSLHLAYSMAPAFVLFNSLVGVLVSFALLNVIWEDGACLDLMGGRL